MKRLLSILLCLILLLSLFPFSALAEDAPAAEDGVPADPVVDTQKEQPSEQPGAAEYGTSGGSDDSSDGDGGGDDAVDADENASDDNEDEYYVIEEYASLNAFETCWPGFGFDSVDWLSSDEEVATVEEDGEITAHRQGEAVVSAFSTTSGEEIGRVFVDVLNTGYLASDPGELCSFGLYGPGDYTFWEYSLPGAESLLVEFSEDTHLGDAYLSFQDGEENALYSLEGEQLNFTGDDLAGAQLRLPGDTFRIYLYSDEDAQPGGFAVSSVEPYTAPEQEESEEEPEPVDTPENPDIPETPEEPEEVSEENNSDGENGSGDNSEESRKTEDGENIEDDEDGEDAEDSSDELVILTMTALPAMNRRIGPSNEPTDAAINNAVFALGASAPAPEAALTEEEIAQAQVEAPTAAADTPVTPVEGGDSAEDNPVSLSEGGGVAAPEGVLLTAAGTPAPTATIVVLPSALTMDALSEEALYATVVAPEGTDLSKLSLAWTADSDLITVTEKNLTPNDAAHMLTGTAMVRAGSQNTEEPVTVTATVMYTADGASEPVPVRVSDAEDAADAQASSSVTVQNNVIVVSDWHQLESAHFYSRPIHTVWQYTVPDPTVQSVTLTFDPMTETVSPNDILRVADGAGRPAGIYTGRLLAGQSVTVNSRVVRIYLDSDDTGFGAWGFKVTNLTTSSSGDAPRYTVRYYANGGVNAPKDQPAHELPLTLSDLTPDREHYEFRGWATDRDSGATYQPGEVIETLDPNTLVGKRLDLFAVWERIPTYNDSNRGVSTAVYSGPVDNSADPPKTTPVSPILIERPETQYDKDVLHIKTVEDLMAFAENCSLDTWSDRLPVVLDNDLSLSGTDFWAIPIFNGCFDGRNHTIYDVSLTDAMAPCGFFLELGSSATVKNLNVAGSVLPGGENNMTGGLVGLNRGMLLNCSFSGTVSGTTDTGGIAGCNAATGILSGCRSTATVSGMNATGGIVGHNLGAVIACESSSFVNIESVDPALNLQTLDTSSILNFIESMSSDTVGVTTDTGGIAGFNEGFIETSVSREVVGYQHLGYNVGGICGRSDGYISTCLNEADVYGRRDVGGILGQAEPYIELRESNSILAGLSYRVYALHRSIDAAANDARVLGSDIADELSGLSLRVRPLEDALLAFDIYDPTAEALEAIREALRNTVSGVTGELESMGESVGEGSSVLSEDLAAIGSNLSALSGTAVQSAQLISSSRGNTVLEDISVSEAESELTLGKTTGCTNRGEIRGDNNVGGIVGCMSVESELNPETDLTNSDFLTRKQNRYRIVVAECLNDGPVTAKKECAGGIAGKADIGYITRSVSYNSISLEDGAYAGGIAGLLYGTVGASVAKCSLSGDKYVGGIVGNGYAPENPEDKSSLVSGCYTLVEIRNRPQFSGAVSGGGEGSYAENYFVPSGYAGLNRLSIQGQAEPVLFSVFSSLNALPDETKHFTLRFVCEGEVVKEVPFEYGASFGKSVFPDMPVKDGAYAVWDRTELTDLRFDTVVTAEYRRSETALKSDLKREDGRAVGYVVGQFQQGDSLEIELIPVDGHEIDSFRLNWRQAAMEQLRSVLDGDPDYSIPISVLEHAVFRFPSDGLDLHTLRYLSPNGATENIRVYQKAADGGWERLHPEVFGSYLSMLSAEGRPELCLVETMQSWWILLWVAGALAALVLLIVIVHHLRKWLKTRRAQRKAASAETAEEGKPRPALQKRRKLLILLFVLLLVLTLGLTAVLQSSRLQVGITGWRVLRDFYSQEADIDTEIRIASGDEALSLDSTVHRIAYKDHMISCADQYGIPLYFTGGDVYLENGRAFRILKNSLDRQTLLRMAIEAFRSGSIAVEQEGDTLRCSTELSADRISQTLRSLLSEEIEGILTVDRLHLALTVEGGQLSELTFVSDGKLEDGKAFNIDVALRPAPLSERSEIPQAVLNAIDTGGRGSELL
ncbi:MAG: InlB B-repeat-containing protein, partial [Candidatus Limivicinus sp.]